MPHSDSDHAFDACVEALSRAPAGLFTDFDGTISNVANSPGEAVLAANAEDALTALGESLAVMAIVTGRSADDARTLVSGEHVSIIGNHGLERITEFGRVVHPDALPQIDQIAQTVALIRQELAEDAATQGALFENKGLSASIHYRQTPDRDAARLRILDLVKREAQARGLHVTEGRLVIELRPTVSVNKGTAVVEVITELGLRGSVYIGDDVTDLDAFKALKSLTGDDFTGTSVVVLSPETDPRVREYADVTVDGVDDCVALLERLGEYFGVRG
ncbi:trehalose-phosphatase [soil metagenome]